VCWLVRESCGRLNGEAEKGNFEKYAAVVKCSGQRAIGKAEELS
jgi:hypothetical protein